MRKTLIGLLACVALLAAAPIAPAQTPVVNPNSVQWDHAGYATAASYELAYFALSVKADHTCDWTSTPATSPTSTTTIPKPATSTGVGMTATLTAKPVGCFVARMRTVDTGGLVSVWADAAAPFTWSPAPVVNLVVKQ